MAHDLDRGIPVFPSAIHEAPARVNFTSRYGNRSLVVLPQRGELPTHTTVADAIGDLPPISNGGGTLRAIPYGTEPLNDYQRRLRTGSVSVTSHRGMALSAINVERLRHIPPGGNWTDIPAQLLPLGMQRARRSDHTKRYGRPKPEGLSSTILTKCDPHWGAYFHYAQDRVITVREAARIQSFPDRYIFTGSVSDQYAQVGNAVPPLMALALGISVRSVLSQVGEISRPQAS